MAIAQPPVYREVYDFWASAPTRQQILAFRPSEATQACVHELLAANKARNLTADETPSLTNLSVSSILCGCLNCIRFSSVRNYPRNRFSVGEGLQTVPIHQLYLSAACRTSS